MICRTASAKRLTAMVERETERPILGLVPSAAQAEKQPSTRYEIQRRCHVGDDTRTTERRAENERAELDT